MRHSCALIRKDVSSGEKRIDRSSMQNCMGKTSRRETDIRGIYPSILNCRYRNDRIVFDWTKCGFPIEEKMKEDSQEIKEEKNFFEIGISI